MARIKPTEIKLVAGILDPEGSGGEDAAAMAEEIIAALDAKRRKDDDTWLVVAQVARWAPVQVYGPLPTKNAAFKFVSRLCSADRDEPGRAVIARLAHPEDLQ